MIAEQEHTEPTRVASVSKAEGFKIICIGLLGACLLRIFGWTWQLRIKEGSSAELLPVEFWSHEMPVIFAFWHDQQLMLPFCFGHRRWQPRPLRLWMLISAHRDGRYIARAVKFLGIDSVAGSSSRGGAGALHRLTGCLQQGDCVAVTPDGPRGPRHRAKLGTVKLAQLSGRSIIPVAVTASRSWTFRSWDKMQLPRPGTTISLAVGRRISVPAQADDEQLKSINLELEQALEGLTSLVGNHE